MVSKIGMALVEMVFGGVELVVILIGGAFIGGLFYLLWGDAKYSLVAATIFVVGEIIIDVLQRLSLIRRRDLEESKRALQQKARKRAEYEERLKKVAVRSGHEGKYKLYFGDADKPKFVGAGDNTITEIELNKYCSLNNINAFRVYDFDTNRQLKNIDVMDGYKGNVRITRYNRI